MEEKKKEEKQIGNPGTMLYKYEKGPRVFQPDEIAKAHKDGWKPIHEFLPERPAAGYHEDDIPQIIKTKEKLLAGTLEDPQIAIDKKKAEEEEIAKKEAADKLEKEKAEKERNEKGKK